MATTGGGPHNEFLTYNETIKALSEFLEVAIHTILYIRQVYPSDLFEPCKKYSVPVYRSRHPLLTTYITSLLQSIISELSTGSLARLCIVILTAVDSQPLERFVFDFEWLLDVRETFGFGEGGDVKGEGRRRRDIRPTQDGLPRSNLALYLRSFLLKLNVIESQLAQLPNDLTWTAVIELSDEADFPHSYSKAKTSKDKYEQPQPWVPADHELTTFGAKEARRAGALAERISQEAGRDDDEDEEETTEEDEEDEGKDGNGEDYEMIDADGDGGVFGRVGGGKDKGRFKGKGKAKEKKNKKKSKKDKGKGKAIEQEEEDIMGGESEMEKKMRMRTARPLKNATLGLVHMGLVVEECEPKYRAYSKMMEKAKNGAEKTSERGRRMV